MPSREKAAGNEENNHRPSERFCAFSILSISSKEEPQDLQTARLASSQSGKGGSPEDSKPKIGLAPLLKMPSWRPRCNFPRKNLGFWLSMFTAEFLSALGIVLRPLEHPVNAQNHAIFGAVENDFAPENKIS